MKKVYQGKTKDVFQLPNGNFQLLFKDDMTGENGIFDPGANTVGLTVFGAGAAGLAMSAYFFRLLESKGYPTHFISADSKTSVMIVKPATVFGKGLEVICRFKALGSFVRRYGEYVTEGSPLNAYVEMTLKDDGRGDPLINKDGLEALGILNPGEYETLKTLTQNICREIKTDLENRGLELCDIKLEFGRGKDGQILLIDEISGGNMRVLNKGKAILPLELSATVLK